MLSETESEITRDKGHCGILDARSMRLCRNGSGGLRMSIGDQLVHVPVELKCAFPRVAPDLCVVVFHANASSEPIGMIEDLRELDPESYRVARSELLERHSIPEIVQIRRLVERRGLLHFDAETNFGPRHFIVSGAHDYVEDRPNNIQILTDVHGDRFAIPDPVKLDRKTRILLERYL